MSVARLATLGTMSFVSDSVHIEFAFTREDYIEYAREHWAGNPPEWRRYYVQRRWMLCGTLVGTVVLAWQFVQYREQGANSDFDTGVLLLLSIAVVYCWWWSVRARRSTLPGVMKQRLDASADTREALAYQGWKRVSMTADGLECESGDLRWHMRWRGVLQISETGSFVRFGSPSQAVALLIPKRVFPSPNAAAEFVRAAQKLHAAAPKGPVERLREFLATRDAACSGCGYNLRGLQSDRCPECAAHLSIDQFEPATRRA